MNEKLKKTLKHYVDLDKYANYVAEELSEEFNICYEECMSILLHSDYYKTKADYSLAYNAIKESVSKFKDKLDERMDKEAEIVKDVETDFLKTLYGTTLTIGAISLPKLLFMPIDNRDTTKQFAERTTKNILRSYDNGLRTGYIFGQSSADIKQEIDKSLKQVEKGMDNGIISAIPSYAKNTDKIVFLQNNQEVTWIATLDGSTCITCAALNGLRYKSVSEAPLYPHFGCRCQVVPTSVIDEIPTFEGFIESLSDEDQESVLGKNRYKMWKEYGIKLDKFLNNGDPIPLKELKESINLIGEKK